MYERNGSVDNEQLEVLNISNVNASGNVVLNDEKLLELIEMYPFLFNQRVRPFNDTDYMDWAWERIEKSFNSSYDECNLSILPFTIQELKMRWNVLQPIIKSLSRAYEIAAIPDSLRQLVLRISGQLEVPCDELIGPKPLYPAQKLVLENIPMVEQLSLGDRKQLEAEVMQLILSVELDSKTSGESSTNCQTQVDREYERFLRAIRLKELFVINSDEDGQVSNGKATHSNKLMGSDVIDVDSSGDSNDGASVKHELHNLLKPLPKKNWIPLSQAQYHVKPCVVRIKKTNMEDYMPLSKIKRERRY